MYIKKVPINGSKKRKWGWIGWWEQGNGMGHAGHGEYRKTMQYDV
jgi:hypothetical protein